MRWREEEEVEGYEIYKYNVRNRGWLFSAVLVTEAEQKWMRSERRPEDAQ